MTEYYDSTVPSPGVKPELRPRFVNIPTGPVQERIVGHVVPSDDRPLGMRVTFSATFTGSLMLEETGAGALTVLLDGQRFYDGDELVRELLKRAKAAADAEQPLPSKPLSPEAQTTLRAIEQVRAEAAQDSSKPLAAASVHLKAKGTGA